MPTPLQLAGWGWLPSVCGMAAVGFAYFKAPMLVCLPDSSKFNLWAWVTPHPAICHMHRWALDCRPACRTRWLL